MSNEPKSNVPEFSVGELAFSMKKTLEDTYSRVRVRGELSRVSIAGSGHMYSSLKDDQAVIDAVCWKGVMQKLSITPEEGLEVICTGRISTYPSRSNYQLIIESMELAGEGALLKMLEERKKKLAAEGLFAPERKKNLPYLPDVIGVVTSPTGAVIRDILHRVNDRFPRDVLVWPVLVQGDGAAAQVANAIRGFDSLPVNGDIPRPDLLIVARGGGSLEDLMPFNEENVVRAVAECSIPVISAVGHETDTTLCDFAADYRAPTPTGAAERAVPVRAELRALTAEYDQRLQNAAARLLRDGGVRLESLSRGLSDPAKLLEMKTQRLDHTGERLSGVFGQFLSAKSQKMIQVSSRLSHPRAQITNASSRLDRWGDALMAQGKNLLREREKTLEHSGKMLEAFSFKKTLERGFVVVRGAGGQILSSAANLGTGDEISLQFKDDNRSAVIGSTNGSAPSSNPAKKAVKSTSKKPAAKPKKDVQEQGQLF